MQEIAEEAGVNQALLHYYFKSKRQLGDAVFRQSAKGVLPVIIQTLGSDLSISEKIEKVVETYLDAMSRTPFLPGYIISELHHHPERTTQLVGTALGSDPSIALKPVLARLDSQLSAERKAGRMKRITAQQFFVNLISLCIFPFAARPMLFATLGFDEPQFAAFIAQRRKELPGLILGMLAP